MKDNKNISIPQLRCIKAMLKKLSLKESDIVNGFTGGREESVSKMLKVEATEAIKYLKENDPDEEAAERMRRKIIGMAYGYAGLGPSATVAQKRETVNRLDRWCKQYGYKHKGLNSYTKAELPKLLTQFEFVLKDLFKSL
jgi:hypothetical protein